MRIIGKNEMLPARTDPKPLLMGSELLEPVKLVLIKEVEADGQPISEIVLRVPNSRDMLESQMSAERTPDRTYQTLAKATEGIPPEAIEALHPRDLDYLTRLYWSYQG